MDIVNITISIGIVINFIIGFLTYLNNKGDKLSLAYNVLVLSVILWSISMILFRVAGEDTKIILMKLLYIAGVFSVYAFLHFTLIFPEGKPWKKLYDLMIMVVALTTAYFVGATNFFVHDVHLIQNSENEVVFGNFFWIYIILIIIPTVIAFYILVKKYLRTSNHLTKSQVIYILTGYFIVANTSFTTNLIMPYLGNHSLSWVGQVSIMFMVSIMSYAILKHHLFNIKVIATQLLIFAIWISVLFQVFLSNTFTIRILNVGLFIAVVFIGILIIRSVLKEVQAREKIEELAKKLKISDQTKSEFMNLASHQLRTPLTIIKGISANLIDKTYGKLNNLQTDSINSISTSAVNMSNLIEDMLNASRIECKQGFNYVFQIGNPIDLIREIVTSLTVTAENKGLKLIFNNKLRKDVKVQFDKQYLRQVISNLIQNAIKYTPKGSVEVTIYLDENNDLIISIKDTGFGMTQKDINNLFKRFFRSKHIKNQITDGTGLGLYLAEQIVRDHEGKIWAESEGLGKGSSFYVSLLLE